MTHSFEDLITWQRAMDLTEAVYKVAALLPAHERFGLASQLRRAAVSVPSNIAEGQKRPYKAEMIQFCGFALGSTAEVETQLLLARKLYGSDVQEGLRLCEETTKLLTALLRSLRTKI